MEKEHLQSQDGNMSQSNKRTEQDYNALMQQYQKLMEKFLTLYHSNKGLQESNEIYHSLLEIYRVTSNYKNTNENIEYALTLITGYMNADTAFLIRREECGFSFSHISYNYLDNKSKNSEASEHTFTTSPFIIDHIKEGFNSKTVQVSTYTGNLDNGSTSKKEQTKLSLYPIQIDGNVNYLLGVLNAKKKPELLSYYSTAFADCIQRTLLEITDKLTGVYNRSYYKEMIEKFERTQPPMVSLIISDLYRLKYVNDNFRHLDGDLYISTMAHILKKFFADKHTYVFRIGGDEFAIISVGKTPEYLDEKIKQVNEYVSIHPIYTSTGVKINAHIDFGYEFANGSLDFDKLSTLADEKMRASKSAYYNLTGDNRRR